MKQKLYNILFSTLIIVLGIATGAFFQNSSYAVSSCDGTTCQHDRISGFRCFSGVDENYTCDDSAYPDCSEEFCGDGGPVPVEN